MKLLGFAFAVLAPAVAQAEVKSATSAGFEIETRRTVAASPAEAYAALGRVASWWSAAHTYSGSAANLSLRLQAGACFCERLVDGGSVEHARVVQARPRQMLRLHGALGPLQAEAVSGTLTFTLKPVAQGTQITQTYVVGGFIRGGADKFAAPVGKVVEEQLDGLVRLLDARGAKRRR